MKKIFSICNIYILLWLAYNMQDIVFGRSGTIFATIIIYALIGVSVYYTFYALFKYKTPSYIKGLTLLVAMFTVYGLILILSGRTIIRNSGAVVANYNYLKQIYISLLPVFAFFVFTKQGKLDENMLRNWVLVFLVLTIISYFITSQQHSIDSENEAEEFTNNLGYVFLSLIPLLAFWDKNKTTQYIVLTIILLFVLLCFKRGAIIIAAICVVVFIIRIIKTTSGTKKIWVVVLSIVVIMAVAYFVSYLLNTSVFFNQRLVETLEGNTSGREGLFEVYWTHFRNETNPFLFIFGNGANATFTIGDNYAHNDWLELAINQGLLGVIIYVVYWMSYYKTWKRSDFNNEIHLGLGIALIIYFLKTFFSMTYGSTPLYANICIGYCMARISEYELSLK